MNVQISPSLEALVQEKVESGSYPDASAVIEEALRILDDRDQRFQQFKDSVTEGFAQVERGEGVELTPEYMDRVFQRAIENARRGKPIKDDVKP